MIIAAILTVLAAVFTWTLAKATAQRDEAERVAILEEHASHPFRK